MVIRRFLGEQVLWSYGSKGLGEVRVVNNVMLTDR
jgi:CRISPR/Cas system CSM-associated protein Csm3 (group 7 of RAMP superfamily)